VSTIPTVNPVNTVNTLALSVLLQLTVSCPR
jgi:hypothetical protein